MTAFNPMASEHKRGKDGLFACCNTVASRAAPPRFGATAADITADMVQFSI